MTGEPEETSRPTDPERGRSAPPKALRNASRALALSRERLTGAGPVGLAVLALGVAAGVLMVVAELSPILQIQIKQSGTCEIVAEPALRSQCAPTGGDRHSYALLVLGALTLVMAWGAGIGRSRAAAAALVAVGLAVLAISLVADLPALNETGAIGVRFDEATSTPAPGFFVELVAGAVALAAGVLRLARPG